MFPRVRYSAHSRRSPVTLAVTVLLTFFLTCHGAEDDTPAEIDTGSTCTKLEKPEHGEYVCRTDLDVEVCKLTCNVEYTLPINEYNNDGQHVLLEDRGIYTCESTPGGRIWMPQNFYDCVPTIHPAYFVYYYSLTLTGQRPLCVDDSKKEHLLNSFEVNTENGITKRNCLTELNLNCYWVYDMKCLQNVWWMDVWLRMPFSLDLLDTFDDWYSKYEGYTQNESLTMFKVGGFLGRTSINRHGFFIECPRGTRIERDYICRGCSKGYYMNQRLLECLPCPPQHFQDTNYAHTCKLCPAGGSKSATGLTKLIDCFHFSYWEEDVSIERIIGGLACVAIFSAVMLFYRSHVRNEPDGRHREVYVEQTIKPIGGGRLQRLMRVLQPMYMFPSQFDQMTVSAQKGTETTRFISKTGKSKIVSQRKKAADSPSSSGSSGSSESSSGS